MASYSRYLFRMLPLRRWPLPGLAPLWLSEPQPACRLLWPSSPSLADRVANELERHFREMETMSRAFFQASPLPAREAEGGQKEAPEGSASEGQPEGERYRCSVDVAGFTPEEMTVKLEGRKVTVTARRQRESESKGGGYWMERRELRREALLPPDVDLQAIACSLSADGRLAIEAPRLAQAEQPIPIDVEPAAKEELGGEEKRTET